MDLAKDRHYQKDYDRSLTPFTPVFNDNETQRADKTTWINNVIDLLADIAEEITAKIRFWLNQLIP
jgi:hypothetical protein